MRKLTAITVAAILLLIGSTALSDPAWHGPGGSRGHGHGPAMDAGHGDCPHGLGFRDGPGPGHRGPGIGMLLQLKDELGLTDEQQTKLTGMITEFQQERIDQRATVQKAKVRLRAMKLDGDVAESSVFAAIDDVSRAQAELKKMHYRHRQAVHEVLTEEQVDKLSDLHKERLGKQHRCPRGEGRGDDGGRGFRRGDDG